MRGGQLSMGSLCVCAPQLGVTAVCQLCADVVRLWERGLASPILGDGKLVKRAHLSQCWSFKLMF